MTLTELSEYQQDYPLSARWGEPTVVRHVTQVGATAIHLVGLSCTDATGRCVLGSAGQLTGSPFGRAYFELLERASMVDAMADEDAWLDICDRSGRRVGVARSRDVFPKSPDERLWRYASSSGVAVGRDWPSATRRAELELIERDRLLRSWYGEIVPRRLALPADLVPESLHEHYELEAYSFAEPVPERALASVAGLFGFPRDAEAPLIFGFGARRAEPEALETAACECLQRLGFLWGETIPGVLPPFSSTPDYHQEYFLHPAHHSRLRTWLAGGHSDHRGILDAASSEPGPHRFVDLTPSALRSKLVVVKTLPAGEVPLTFGRGHPRLRATPPEMLAVHPIP